MNTALEKINAALEKFGDNARWVRPPQYRKIYDALKGKRVVIVDDAIEILTLFLPELMVATDGYCFPILHTTESAEELAREIIQYKPDIILMDYYLAGFFDNRPDRITGADVIKILRNYESMNIIGFSSSGRVVNLFMDVGTDYCIDKTSGMPDEIITRVAQFIASCTK